jgi:hypothetical protein
MKKLSGIFFALILFLSATANADNASLNSTAATEQNKEYKLTKAETRNLVDRLKQIRRASKGHLDVQQKHDLRNEVLLIKQQLTHSEQGTVIYLSTAAIIIIVLLIILL